MGRLGARSTRSKRGKYTASIAARPAADARSQRRIGDAAWRYFASRTDAAKAFRVTTNDVGYLLREPSKASRYACEFEARPAPAPKKRERPTYRSVEGAKPKTNGKWRSGLFPGREFDDLDEYRAAKKQREERREEYRAQARDNRCHVH